ncbi:MAG: hypothetical protein CUN53_00245 [Phototrophicales bacterium]|nr:MAG: hypothetical protein CUN53_00245 [Phototrophicales bacterium]
MSKRMTSPQARRSKGSNGSSDSIVIHFDPDDPTEARALEMSKLLALKHGRRRATIVAALEAMHVLHERSGRVLTPIEVASAILGQPTPTITVAAAAAAAPRRKIEAKPDEAAAPSRAGKTLVQRQAEESAANYLKGMASLFE